MAGGLNLYAFGAGDPVNFTDPFGLCPPEWLCRLIGASAGQSAAEYYAGVAIDPSRSGLERAGATVGGLFASLWTPDTYLQTAATLAGGAGESRALVGRAAAAAEAGGGLEPSAGMMRQFGRQLAQHGRGSVERSVRSLERRLGEHLTKLEEITARGGNPGSVHREIDNFRRMIEAARRILEQ